MSKLKVPVKRAVGTAPTARSKLEVRAPRTDFSLDDERRRIARRQLLDRWVMPIVVPILLVSVWEALSRAGILDDRFFPAPTAISGTFFDLVGDGTLVSNTVTTVRRTVVGCALGAIPGTLIGLAMGMWPWARSIATPIVAALFPVPKIAIFPLVLLVFGLSETAFYVNVALGIVFLVVVYTTAGVLTIPRAYLDVGRNFRASGIDYFRTVIIPGALPNIFTGFQLSLTISLIITVATEFVSSSEGLGAMIWRSWSLFQVETMFAGVVVCAIIGIVFHYGMEAVRRRLIPWAPQQSI